MHTAFYFVVAGLLGCEIKLSPLITANSLNTGVTYTYLVEPAQSWISTLQVASMSRGLSLWHNGYVLSTSCLEPLFPRNHAVLV